MALFSLHFAPNLYYFTYKFTELTSFYLNTKGPTDPLNSCQRHAQAAVLTHALTALTAAVMANKHADNHHTCTQID